MCTAASFTQSPARCAYRSVVCPRNVPVAPDHRQALPKRQRSRLVGGRVFRARNTHHTFASLAVMGGLDLYTVGRLLGHADTGSTERYAHLADEHVREAVGRVSGIVNDAMTGSGKEVSHDK